MAAERTRMLYERWLQVASACPHQKALCDVAAGHSWTFGQLAAEIESAPQTRPQVVFPKGIGASFVLDILRAWRSVRIVSPLEPGQLPLVLSAPLTAAIAHIKTTS